VSDGCPYCGSAAVPRCLVCGEPAVAYCDAVLGFTADDGGLVGRHSKSFTCDAPMCEAHTKMIGHVCGRYADTIDHCQWHAEFDVRGLVIMTADEAATARRAIWARMLRLRARREPTGADSVTT
jgi:hypothetical protein